MRVWGECSAYLLFLFVFFFCRNVVFLLFLLHGSEIVSFENMRITAKTYLQVFAIRLRRTYTANLRLRHFWLVIPSAADWLGVWAILSTFAAHPFYYFASVYSFAEGLTIFTSCMHFLHDTQMESLTITNTWSYLPIHCPVSVSHNLHILSYEALRNRLPSLSKLTSLTACLWPLYVLARRLSLYTSHIYQHVNSY